MTRPTPRPPEDIVTRALRAGMRVDLGGYEVAMGHDTVTGIEEPVIVAQRYTAGKEDEAVEVAVELDPRTFVRMCRDLDADTLIALAVTTVLRQMANERNEARLAHMERLAARREVLGGSEMRSWTITNMAGDGSTCCTVEAPDRASALEAFAHEQGYASLHLYLSARGLTVEDLAVHEDADE